MPVGFAIENRLHHPLIIVVLLRERLQRLVNRRSRAFGSQSRIVQIHIIHIVVTRIVCNLQLRISNEQLLQRIFHRQNTTNNYRALGIYIRFSCKNFGESFIHPLRNRLMLLGTPPCQLAVATISLSANQPHFAQHVLTRRRQLTQTVGTHQYRIRPVISPRTDQIARPVPPVVADIKRPIPFGRRREHLLRTGISHIVTRRQILVFLEILTCLLRTNAERKKQ